MADSVVRVVLTLAIGGKSVEINRPISSGDFHSDVPDAQVIAFARSMTDRALHALGFSDEQIRRAVLNDE